MLSMNDNLSDNHIDVLLTAYAGEERLSSLLERLNLETGNAARWAYDLHTLGLFNVNGKPDYITLTSLGQEIKQNGGWIRYNAMYNTKTLFDRILSTLFELQDSGQFHNLFDRFPDIDKVVLRSKVKELQKQNLIEIKSEHVAPTFYGTEIFDPIQMSINRTRREKLRKKYETELLVKITWQGVQYWRGSVLQPVTHINDSSMKTVQNIIGSTVHGHLSQSSGSHNIQMPPAKGSHNKTAKQIAIGVIITVVGGIILSYILSLF